jgi:hypothetical protein
MSGDFITMVNRIATELRRSNMSDAIKNAINDAIGEAAQNRFSLNEYLGYTFQTVIGQEYYDDLGIVEVDRKGFWWLNGTSRWNLWQSNNIDMNDYALGTTPNGPPTEYSRVAGQFRLYPIPNTIITMHLGGYGKLTPYPLVNDADTNNWMTQGERYIRALAKTKVLTDVIKDFQQAAVYEAVSESAKMDLFTITTQHSGTGELYPTQF